MKPLIVLLATFGMSVLALKLIYSETDVPFAARIALSVMLLFTAIAHFAFTKGMTMMLPDFIPCKTATVYLTGFIEIAAAIGIFIPSARMIAGWLLIVFFIFLLPANIYAAIKHIDYQKGTFEGNGLNYLWFRVPLQVLFIVWTYLSCIRF